MSSIDKETLARFKREERSATARTVTQLLSILVIPLALIIILGAILLMRDVERVSVAERKIFLVDLSIEATDLIAELQKERGMSAGFVGSKGAQFRQELNAQRQATDAALAGAWRRVSGSDVSGLPEDLQARLTGYRDAVAERLLEITNFRERIDDLAITTSEFVPYYTSMIVDLIALADTSVASEGDHDSVALAEIHHVAVVAAEYAGRERAVGAQGFGRGGFDIDLYSRAVGLQSRQISQLDRIAEIAIGDIGPLLDDMLNGPEVARIKELRQLAADSVKSGDVGGVTGPEWFAASTAYLKRLNALKSVAGEALAANAAAERDRLTLILWEIALSVVGVVIATLLIAVYQCLVQARAMMKLTRGLQRMARGLTDIWVTGVERKDIIGLLARSMVSIAKQGEENTQIRSALNVSVSQMMITDANNNIIFVNAALEASAEESMDFFMEELDDFDPLVMYEYLYKLVDQKLQEAGTPIDTIDGAEQIEVSFNERYFTVVVTPVFDTEQRRAGATIEWREVTASRLIEQQLSVIIDATRHGDFSQQITVETSTPFFTVVADGMNAVSGQISAFVQDLSAALSALAEGNLTRRVDGTYEGDLKRLGDATNATIDRLGDMVAQITSGSVKIQERGSEIRNSAQRLSERSEDSASSLEETAAAMETISKTVSSTSDLAGDANKIADETRESADRGGQVVKEVVDAMERIRESSERINEIVAVIDGIAFQTNLLALNAAVEAARAGDAGKGFAVVASEVRSLAQRSAEAARDITGLISASSENVADGVRLVEATGASLEEIVTAISETTEKISQITTACRDQAMSVTEITRTINHLDNATQENASISEVNANHAISLAQEADVLSDLVRQFKTATTINALWDDAA